MPFTFQQLLDDPAPGPMYDNPLVYDSVNKKAIMYGAYFGGTYEPDAYQTWEYDGINWTQVFPIADAGVRWYGASGAYDPDAQVFMMHGGRNISGNLNQLWEYNGITWTNRTPGAGPNPGNARSKGLVYDTTNNVLLYYRDYDRTMFWFNRVAMQWVQMVAPAGVPPPTTLTTGCDSAFDQLRGVMVRFGGYDTLAGLYTSDVYEFDFATNTWSKPVLLVAPGARSHHSTSWSTALQKIVITGGKGGDGYHNWGDVWSWDGSSWKLLSDVGSDILIGSSNKAVYGIPDGFGYYQPDLLNYPWLIHCRTGRLMCDGGGATGLLGSSDKRGDVIVYGGDWIWPISVS